MPSKDPLLDRLERRKGALEKERLSFIPHYKEISAAIQPRRGRFLIDDVNKGDKRHNAIINSKATQAYQICRAGMVSGTISASRPWFAIETPDPDLMEFEPVKLWLFTVQKILMAILNDSNFYSMAPVLVGELILFGTGAMSHVDDFESVARFYAHTAGSYMIAQDERYVVNTIVREYKMTTEQMAGKFGLDKVSTTVKNAYDRGNYDDLHKVVHFIDENPERKDDNPFSTRKPFRSIYYQPDALKRDQPLSVKGFNEFPASCPRWDLTGEDVYGTDCPGMTALGDTNGLQIEERRKAQAIDKMVTPPLKGPPSLRGKAVANLPGGLTTYDGDATREGLSPVYTVNPQIGELKQDIERVERRIGTAFYEDLFFAITNMQGIQPRNELDLMQRNEERLLQLGPVLTRMHTDFNDRTITRLFNQAARAGILPPPPPELEGKEIQIRYISTLAQAQRAVATGGLERMVNFVGVLVNAGFENARYKVDAEQAVDDYANAIGVSPRIIVPDDVVARQKVEAQQRAEQERALVMAQAGADAANKAAGANTEGKNLLTDMNRAIAGRQ